MSDWESILKNGLAGLSYEGKWEVFGSTLRVDSTGAGSWLSAIDRAVENFSLKTSLSVVTTGNASIFFRQDHLRYYQFDLRCGMHAAVIGKVNGDGTRQLIIDAVNLDLFQGMRYDVEIAVRGESITTYVNGQRTNHVRDGEYANGGICLTAWNSRAEFHDPRLRIY